jgi:hypothetical protein
MLAQQILETTSSRQIHPLIPFQQTPHKESNPIRNVLADRTRPIPGNRQNV